MPFHRESLIDDYTKRSLDHVVKSLINDRLTWIITVVILLTVIWVGLAFWIYSAVNRTIQDTVDVNNQKRVVILKELETDSLKKKTIEQMHFTYDSTVAEWAKNRKQKYKYQKLAKPQ